MKDDMLLWLVMFALALFLFNLEHSTRLWSFSSNEIQVPKLGQGNLTKTIEMIRTSVGTGVNQITHWEDPKIIVTKICNTEPDEIGDCDTSSVIDEPVLYFYWEILNGAGCCATFNCDRELFWNTCIYPEFKLYNLYLDGVKIPFDYEGYTYTCEKRVPWNWQSFEFEEGEHTIKIENLNCTNTVIDSKELKFQLQQIEGKYVVVRYD